MNNRERQWYEGKYGRHPPTCNCADCIEKQKVAMREETELFEEQAKMRGGAEERVAQIKKRVEE